MDPFPSSPSSAWSSANNDRLSPHTPDSYFFPAPAIVAPDDFTFQIDVQLDQMVSPHPSPGPCLPSGDDMSKAQVLMRNTGRWGNIHDRFDSSPPLKLSGASDDFHFETNHSALAGSNHLSEPSRCSLLIHEVSLLIGLTTEDDHLSCDDDPPPLPDAPKQVHDILPPSLTPTKSLACRKRRNAGLPHTDIPVHSSDISVPPSINLPADNVDPNLYNFGYPPVGSRDPATPILRYKSADAARPSLSPRRRHGQVFLGSSTSNAHHQNALDSEEMFTHPREPPPKPTSNPANRCSSLDRLECSLLKLEAHAPRNHRKSRSEGRPSNHVAQRKDKRPSLPPPPRLKHQPGHEIMHRIPSRPDHSYPPPPVPRPMLPHQYVAPPICPLAVVSVDEDHFEEDPTPSSFMDMDILLMEEAQPKRRSSFRHVKSKERVKSLVRVAKRVSRGVISWGKNLTGSSKPSVPAKETANLRSAHV